MPHGSILGPVLFNLYVVNLVENLTCISLQYADDSTLYKHSKPKKLKKCIEELESDLETVSLWFSNNSLVFNGDKTKLILFSTTHLSQKHNLSNNELFRIMHNCEGIERVNTKKILGIHFDENQSWSYHVLGRYVKEDDLIKMLCWLPMAELIDFSIANCCFSALHDPN